MSSEDNLVWYHCGHCGSLFKSEFGFNEGRICEACQTTPSVGLWPEKAVGTPVRTGKRANLGPAELNAQVTKIHKTRKRRISLATRFIIGWIVLLISVVGLRRCYKKVEVQNMNVKSADQQVALEYSRMKEL